MALPAEVMADAWYRGGVKLLADSANRESPAYAYNFDYVTPNVRASHPGAAHTFELPFVFGSLGLVLPSPAEPQPGGDQCAHIDKAAVDVKERGAWSNYWFPMADERDREDRSMSQQLASSWVAFARTGDPNVAGQPQWPRYDLKSDVMRNFNPGANGLVRGLEKDRVDYQLGTLRAFYKLK